MKNKNTILSILLLFLFSEQINSLKILTVLPSHAKSHWFIGSAIAKTLAEAGHEITVVSCFPIKNPPNNYRDIKLDGLHEIFEAQFNSFSMSAVAVMYGIRSMGLRFSEQVLTHPNVIKLLNDKSEKFDLVIVELFAMPTLLGFGQHFNAPVIGFSSCGSAKWIYDVSGNTAPLSYVPNIFLDTTSQMTFIQRLNNGWITTVEYWIDDVFNLFQKRLYKKYFPNAKMTYRDMVQKGVSLVFLNTHFSLSLPSPYLPNTIEIGGIHIERKIQPLPENLLKLIDSAEHGVIYFSLGSNIKSSHFPYENQQAFVKAFSQLKQKVIWKFDKTDIDNLSDNVLVGSWFPQNDILAHANIKLFISNGGLLSLTEAVYHAKPIIGIPHFSDQKLNVAFAEKEGFGFKLKSNGLTFETISKALKTVLSNQSYSENVKRISNIFHDQPMTPKEKLIYWVEYVARYNGAPHLQSAGQDLSYWEYHMIDVYAFILVELFVVFFCLIFICRQIFVKKTKVE